MSLGRLVFHKFSKVLARKGIYLTRSLSFRAREQALPPNFDYIRYATLGLCYEEIRNKGVAGNVAEVGVYKGDFASRLNQLFPDRPIYLFDTFEGFSDSDVREDHRRGFTTGSQDFSDTSWQSVQERMPYPGQCIIRKGLFPHTAQGIEDTFCFVSLDADLYTPIYEGLRFFYPRLSRGGYIFVHDFNNEQYKGCREAVLQYCAEQGISYLPIPDNGGTAVLTK